MNDDVARIKNDLQTIENALGLNVWTRRDVRRGAFGVLAGGAAGLFLAIWTACGGEPVIGVSGFLAISAAILVAKDFGYRRNPAPAPGSRREVSFYQRYYAVGSLLIGCFFLWGQRLRLDPLILLSCSIVMVGFWYILYAISAPSRHISIGGALPLTLCGFVLPHASGLSEAFCWIGCAACVGCWTEAVLLFAALRARPGPSSSGPPNAGPCGPVTAPITPANPLSPASHAAY